MARKTTRLCSFSYTRAAKGIIDRKLSVCFCKRRVYYNIDTAAVEVAQVHHKRCPFSKSHICDGHSK